MGKFKIRMMNIVYLVLSGFAILWYSLNFLSPNKAPFLKFALEANLTAENTAQVLTDDTLSSLNMTREDLFADGPIKLGVEIQVKNKMLFDVWQSDDAATLIDNTFIQPNIDSMVEQLKAPLMGVAKSAAKGAVKSMLEDQLNQQYGGEFYDKLAESGLSSEDLSNDVADIMDIFTGENATVDAVSDEIVNRMDKYYEALGKEALDKEEVKQSLTDSLSSMDLIDENGNITSMEDAIAALLGGMLDGSGEGSGEGGGEGQGESAYIKLRRMLNPMYDGEEPAKEDPIATKLKSFIQDKLTAETKETIALAFKICGIVWAVFVLGWALKLIQVILGFFLEKPYIRPEIIGAIGRTVQFILALISFTILAMFKFGLLEKIMSIEAIGSIVKAIPVPLDAIANFEVTFSAMIPGALIVAEFIYGFFYGHAKRQFKREYKEEHA